MAKDLYDVAKEVTLGAGFPWTDPRTLETHQPPEPRGSCGHCGLNTTPRHDDGPWEYYMVHDDIWGTAGAGRGFLCIGCLERNLGRKLTPADFSNAPVNDPAGKRPRTPRLLNRLGR